MSPRLPSPLWGKVAQRAGWGAGSYLLLVQHWLRSVDFIRDSATRNFRTDYLWLRFVEYTLGSVARKSRTGYRWVRSAQLSDAFNCCLLPTLMASLGRFRTTSARPQNPHRLPLASFRKIGARVERQQNPHRLPLASFRKIGARVEYSQNPRSLPLGSVKFRSGPPHRAVRARGDRSTQLAGLRCKVLGSLFRA
jgi:hypothetical protein